ncbi:MAG TPA: cell division protein ZapA [Tissierellaceae bacterium]|nr:cell division protein ZapA [Tissierellaceae bacterium]
MTRDKKIEVIIDGRNFTVVGGENEDYVRDLAYYVDKNIRKLTSKNAHLSQPMAAILAALNIADEYHKTKEQLKVLEDKAKDPLEKYDLVCDELDEIKEELEKFKIKNKELEESLQKGDTKEKKLLEEIKGLKSNRGNFKEEIQDLKEEINRLQDKNFKDQVELVEVKKELAEYIRVSDSGSSKENREGQ